MSDPTTPLRRERSETQRVKRRLRVLERRAAHLADTIADPERFGRISEVAQHHVVAEHNAIVWALGFMQRHRKALFDEALAMDSVSGRFTQKGAQDANPV